MESNFLIIFIFTLIGHTISSELPPYIKPCRRSDPKLDECAVKHANEALPIILKGDKERNLPNLLPLEIPEVKMQHGKNLKINLKNCKLYGLEDTIIKKVKFDFMKKTCMIQADVKKLILISDYEVDGKILVLPIQGKGFSNITFVNGDYSFDFNYKFQERHGKRFFKFDKHNLEFTITRAHVKLDNLFNGNKDLGENMNKFLDENWKEVHEELYPSLRETVSIIIMKIASGYFHNIPYDDIFLP